MTSTSGVQNVWIARHGERIDFVDRAWGETAEHPYDPHLSENGRRQARDLAHRLRDEPIRYVFSSPFFRTLETASFVAQALELPVRIEQGASEMLNAAWFPSDPRIHPIEELARRYPRIDTSYQSVVDPTYPEDWPRCLDRTARAIHRLVDRCDGDLFIAGHGASVSGLAWGLLGSSPQFSGMCCSLVHLRRNGAGGWDLLLAGDTSHLSYCEPVKRFA